MTRYELKAVQHPQNESALLHKLKSHSLGFFKAYPDRKVCNVYFDTFSLDSLYDNLDGISRRYKFRLRWYPRQEWTNIDGAQLEIKCKADNLGWKVTCPVYGTVDLKTASWDQVRSIVYESLKPEDNIFFKQHDRPVLINTYDRAYYVSRDGNVRVTLDKNIRYFNQLLFSTPNIIGEEPVSSGLVVEFKADATAEDQLSDFLDGLPVLVDKNSKYLRWTEPYFAT